MSINVNDKENTSIYFTSPLFLPCTIEDPNFLGVYSSTSTLPTAPNNFNTAGIAGTGSMYVYLNNAWQYIGQYLYDAYRYLVYYQGSAFASASGTKWQSIFNDIASNSSLMTEFNGNSTAVTNLIASATAMNAIANNPNTAIPPIVNNSTLMTTLAGSSTYMSPIVASSTAINAIAGSSTAMNTITASSTAMNAVAASSTAMNAVAASSTAMNIVAASSTAMNAVIASYTAMNAMTTLVAKNAFQSASSQLSIIQTLVSKINSGSIVLGGGATGSSSALGSNALLVLLSYNNGAAVPPGNATSSPTPTLAQNMYTAYSPTQYSFSSSSNSSTSAVTLAPNQIVFGIAVVNVEANGSNYVGMGNASGYTTNGTGASNIILTNSIGNVYPNEGTSPLLLSGALYVEVTGEFTNSYYYLTYTPS